MSGGGQLAGPWWRWLVAAVLLASWWPVTAGAAVNSCNVFYSPDSVAPGKVAQFRFEVHSGAIVPLSEIVIMPPAAEDAVISSGTASGFTANVFDGGIDFSGGTLAPHAQQDFIVNATVVNQEGNYGPWMVYAADGNDMSLPCTGNMNLIVNAATTGVQISNVGLETVAQTAVTVRWDTDVPATSQVKYGATSAYDHVSDLDSRLTLNHQVTLRGLTPDTAYHFMVMSTVPASGDANASLDNTFITARIPPPIIQPAIVTLPGAVVRETVPPAITMGQLPSKPQADSPVVAGTATDNAGVAAVEYSVNDGSTWRPVTAVKPATGGPRVTYEFRPTLPDDGTYLVRVRAIDTSGNVTVSAPQRLIIDRLAPRFAAPEFQLGSQALPPDASGRWQIIAAQAAEVSVVAVGGPSRATLSARLVHTTAAAQTFRLQADGELGQWRGLIELAAPGSYTLTIDADDDAGNHTTQDIGTLVVARPGRVVSGSPVRGVSGAKVTLYYQAIDTHQWLVWDGSGYGQTNPVRVQGAGTVSYVVPPGTYYAAVEAPGYRSQVSQIITVDRAQVLEPNFMLQAWRGWSWPSLADHALVQNQVKTGETSPMVGRPFPEVPLPMVGGGTFHRLQLLGRPSIVTVMNMRSNAAAEQLQVLSELAQGGKVQAMVVVPGGKLGQVQAFWSSGQYVVPAVSDVQMELAGQLSARSTIVHYVIDRSGVIRNVLYGTTSRDELVRAADRL